MGLILVLTSPTPCQAGLDHEHQLRSEGKEASVGASGVLVLNTEVVWHRLELGNHSNLLLEPSVSSPRAHFPVTPESPP